MPYNLKLASGKIIELGDITYEAALKKAKFRGRTAADLTAVGETPATPEPTPAPTPTPETKAGVTSEADLKASIAKKYGIQDTAKWTGKPIPPEALLTPEEQAYVKATYGAPAAAAAYTQAQQDEYDAYLAFLKTPGGKNFPVPENIKDYLAHIEEWTTNAEFYIRGFTEEQLREFNTWKRYASAMGTPDDWYPTNIEDYLANYDLAQQQLDAWKQEYGAEEVERIEEETEREEYALPPAEAARRREESYEEARYAAEERYREAPMYPETFAGWMGEQRDISQALKGYIEREYPSLQAEYKAEVGRLPGFPTREEARTEAERRERGWEAWLGERRPEVREEYYMQRPTERGERLWLQDPTMRAVSW